MAQLQAMLEQKVVCRLPMIFEPKLSEDCHGAKHFFCGKYFDQIGEIGCTYSLRQKPMSRPSS